MTGEAGSEQRGGIGARLRSAREKRGMTLLHAAEKLHLEPRVLESLEAENFAPLGASVYVRGHLRRYAELIGESPAQLQELYASAAQPEPPDLTRIPRALPGGDTSPLALPAVLVTVGLALAGVLWWAMSLPRATPQAVPVAQSPAPKEAGTGAAPAPTASTRPPIPTPAAASPAGAAAGEAAGEAARQLPKARPHRRLRERLADPAAPAVPAVLAPTADSPPVQQRIGDTGTPDGQ